MATAIGSGVFYIADYIIFAVFLLISAGFVLYHACSGGRQRTTSEFLAGDRRLRTPPVPLSIVVSYVNGIIVIGHPAKVYTHGTQLSITCIGFDIGGLLASAILVPLLFRLKVISSFEVLIKLRWLNILNWS